MSNDEKSGVFIISGPSGAGKSTVVKKVLHAATVPVHLSVSATTRLPRPNEVDGQDYYFLSQDEFQKRKENGEFLEFKEVFGRGDWYGTLGCEVSTSREQGKCVILEIDVEGAMQVLQQVPNAVTIFITPGSIDELERRLRARDTETEESIQRRLEVATLEFEMIDHYHYRVVNPTDRHDEAVGEILRILETHCGVEA